MTFSRLQLSFVIILFIGISNHVLMLPHLLFVAKRDAWVCVLVGYGILLIWGMILFFIMSRNKQKMKLATWIAKRAGRVVSASIMFIYFFHISIIALISFYNIHKDILSSSHTTMDRRPSFPSIVCMGS